VPCSPRPHSTRDSDAGHPDKQGSRIQTPRMTPPIRFGSAEIRPAERQLLIDGRPAAIGARAYDVLNWLVTHRERVVSKEALLEAAWPGLVVEENNLQVQISTLRKILGAGAITTVTGLGYQFTAKLEDGLAEVPRARADQIASAGALPTEPAATISVSQANAASASIPRSHRNRTLLAVAAGIMAVLGLSLWIYTKARQQASTAPPGAQVPAHSVAVLPFANMSGDPSQDYFSDGLSEELLDSLSSIPDLHVAARTSSFAFKDKGVAIADIGRKLNVGTVLEGSVRKDGQHVRISAQLVDVATGFDLWSHSYDRDITNILALQTEIAAAVTKALQATLLPDAAAVIELGGTQNAQAFEAYLQGETLEGRIDKEAVLTRIAAYQEAIRQDPHFAKAYVGEAAALDLFGGSMAASPRVHEYYERARAAAEKALALAPELGRAHSVLAQILLFGYFDFSHSLAENDRALALSPGDTYVLRRSVRPLALLGRAESAVRNAQRAVALDPINGLSYMGLGFANYYARQYPQAIEAFNRALSINPELGDASAFRGLSYRSLGKMDAASDSCAQPPINTYNLVCLAIVYHEQGRLPDAEVALTKIEGSLGEAAAIQYVEIYTQWNNFPTALSWLDAADRLRDVGLVSLKRDVLLDPLRKEPRFQKIEHKLQFPN
jgi:TolB-like protein/DNA-binding winged helix-turn-helix (wHTH) protein